MAKILVYTSPARGHRYPLVPTLEELRRRGHAVAVRTLASEVERVRALGFSAEPIAPAIEARAIDDWRASSPPAALLAAGRTFVERGRHELADLRRAIVDERAELLYVDVNTWGAAAVAEASGLPWAVFAPYLQPIRAPGVPPWGLGYAPLRGPLGWLRDALLWRVLDALFDRVLPDLNRLRRSAGAAPLRHLTEASRAAPRIVAYTAEPFEYPRAWPASVRLVGPGLWEPPTGAAPALPDDGRPVVLVTCSTEYQNDGRLVEAALEALADEPVRIVATTASIDPAQFRPPANATVVRFAPHGPLLARASCVVCHGGMGITQKALAAGVPVCVVPFGRDQLEVARHVDVARAGTRLPSRRLSPTRLRAAVRVATTRREGAARIAAAFREAGGASAAADALEELAPRRAATTPPHGLRAPAEARA
ncbi:MAG: glycosyltransferase [Polyangiaceae bacterium]|nr:glycosyltransferase [Polyangiaceae bacterium]